MCWVEPIAFSDLCKWLDSIAMHQADRCDSANGWHYIGDSLCAPCPWFFGVDTWDNFHSLGAKDGCCSCLAWPFSALLNNFACDTARTQQTAIHDYLSVYCQSRCVVCQYFA